MENTEKNSRKSNFYFFYIFLLFLLLIFGGIYFYYTEEDRKLTNAINSIAETNAPYKKISNDSIVSINERNIQEKEYITKKLKNSTNLKPKFGIKFKELLKKINTLTGIDQETLELKTKEEREEITRKVLDTELKLSMFKFALGKATKEKFDEINYLKEQKEWLKKFYPESGKSEEDEEVTARLNDFLNYFYKEFRTRKNLHFPKVVQLVKNDKGEYYPPNEPSPAVIKQEISKLKNRYPHINFDDKAKINFLGFKGWIRNEEKEKGTTTAGLTTYHNNFELNINETRFSSCLSRNIHITLHKAFPFSRKGKEYNLWLVETNEGIRTIFLGWNNLIETIAHELAHAVINSTKIYYRGNKHKKLEDGEEIEEGGHGILHREYTQELKKMIKNDTVEYPSFKKFWFKNN